VNAGSSLDIVIVSYRCRDLLRGCLKSIRENPAGRPTTVRVVDNASADGTVEMVTAEFPEVELTAADRNLGFSAANNLAIAQGNAEFVLALNPDTRLEPGTLDTLLTLMDREPRIAVSGPRLIRPDGSEDHAGKRSFPTPVSALGHFLRVGRRLTSGPLAAYRAPEVESGPVDAVNGAFMLMRRAAFEEVGGFDEGYWMYMEDLDLCYRLAQAGWTTWYEPSVTTMHVKGGSVDGARPPRLNYAFHYGMYRFYRKHYAAHRPLALNLLVYAGVAAKLAASVVSSAVTRTRSDVERRRNLARGGG
jgi:N-acetylglucosaminyl-diphospho-decaprenol L-rhamnosyltransferase